MTAPCLEPKDSHRLWGEIQDYFSKCMGFEIWFLPISLPSSSNNSPSWAPDTLNTVSQNWPGPPRPLCFLFRRPLPLPCLLNPNHLLRLKTNIALSREPLFPRLPKTEYSHPWVLRVTGRTVEVNLSRPCNPKKPAILTSKPLKFPAVVRADAVAEHSPCCWAVWQGGYERVSPKDRRLDQRPLRSCHLAGVIYDISHNLPVLCFY